MQEGYVIIHKVIAQRHNKRVKKCMQKKRIVNSRKAKEEEEEEEATYLV